MPSKVYLVYSDLDCTKVSWKFIHFSGTGYS